jgi:hypothetical protein
MGMSWWSGDKWVLLLQMHHSATFTTMSSEWFPRGEHGTNLRVAWSFTAVTIQVRMVQVLWMGMRGQGQEERDQPAAV